MCLRGPLHASRPSPGSPSGSGGDHGLRLRKRLAARLSGRPGEFRPSRSRSRARSREPLQAGRPAGRRADRAFVLAVRHFDRALVPALGGPARGHRPAGQPRAAPRREEVRPRQGMPAGDLRRVLDSRRDPGVRRAGVPRRSPRNHQEREARAARVPHDRRNGSREARGDVRPYPRARVDPASPPGRQGDEPRRAIRRSAPRHRSIGVRWRVVAGGRLLPGRVARPREGGRGGGGGRAGGGGAAARAALGQMREEALGF